MVNVTKCSLITALFTNISDLYMKVLNMVVISVTNNFQNKLVWQDMLGKYMTASNKKKIFKIIN